MHSRREYATRRAFALDSSVLAKASTCFHDDGNVYAPSTGSAVMLKIGRDKGDSVTL